MANLGSVLVMAKETKKINTEITERPPVIAVMGHIDHGKSTLLDYIRESNIAEKEAGGITQQISAYEVEREKDGQTKKITFLDTPGHEAFTTMRERGALISDIAILVVSAEEGVKTQTLEALESITKVGIPYVVAINKIDRPNANPENTKQSLAEKEILVESYGGKIPSINISAKTGEGVDDLLDLLSLMAEMEELTGTKNVEATGYVLETNREPQSGNMVTLVIKNGSMKVGDLVAVGSNLGKIKKMENFLGQNIKEASFSSPVLIYGFSESPAIGKSFVTFKDKKTAEKHVAEVLDKEKDKAKTTEDKIETGDDTIIPLVIKADTFGTLEAVQREVTKLENERIYLKTVQSGIGTISENDARMLTGSSNAIIVGFNVSVDRNAKDLAERFNITINTFDIIYKLSEWLEEESIKRRPIITVEKPIGQAKILKLFNTNKNQQVIGGRVDSGKIAKADKFNVLRRDIKIGQGKIIGLQQNKADTGEVSEGNEFGALIEIKSKTEIAPGDFLEVFILEKQ